MVRRNSDLKKMSLAIPHGYENIVLSDIDRFREELRMLYRAHKARELDSELDPLPTEQGAVRVINQVGNPYEYRQIHLLHRSRTIAAITAKINKLYRTNSLVLRGEEYIILP